MENAIDLNLLKFCVVNVFLSFCVRQRVVQKVLRFIDFFTDFSISFMKLVFSARFTQITPCISESIMFGPRSI